MGAGDGNDPDDLIVQAFKAYEFEGKIDAGMFKHALMTWGDKFSAAEVDDIFGEFEIDEDNMIKSKDVIGLFVAQKEEVMKEAPRKRRRRRRLPSKHYKLPKLPLTFLMMVFHSMYISSASLAK